MSVRLSSKKDYESLFDKYDTWMFDCDGVLWHGDRLINGAIDVLRILRSKSGWIHHFHDLISHYSSDKKVLFVTNNATKSRREYKKKFDQLGVEAHVVSTPSQMHRPGSPSPPG